MNLRLLIFSAALALSTSLLAAEMGEKMPDCSLIQVNDAQHFKLQRTPDKVLYVDFWASWCPPCAQSFPFMNDLNRDFKSKGLQVIAINMDQSLEDTKTFLSKYPANFTVMTDIDEQCTKRFDLKAMPSSYLVDRNGVIRYTHLGFRTDDTQVIRTLIEQLIAEPPAQK